MHLVWFRNDLRLADHPALYHACEQARATGQPVRAIYALTPGQWQQHDEAAVKLGLRQAALVKLQQQLADLGVVLDCVQADNYGALAKSISAYAQQHQVQHLWFNREFPLDENHRDQTVVAACEAQGIGCHGFEVDCLVTQPVRTQQGEVYRVFTPWYRRWLMLLQQELPEPLPEPAGLKLSPAHTHMPIPAPIQLPGAGDFRQDLWPVDDASVQQRLHDFCSNRIQRYKDLRDIPSVKGTSTVSTYLASGLLSPRQCLAAVQQAAAEHGFNWLENDWLRELAWREFYRYLMLHSPQLSMGQPFRAHTANMQWLFDERQDQAWQQGMTGFPIVDAGMRQLLRTGWMHNRLRMITASFYAKLMLHDWQRGEQFFMQHLIDGDFASNNGGWQWCASTGCDASPWFRVFNPTTQSSRFDANGDFIRKLVPELASLDAKSIHDPSPEQREALGYPQPIIDYKAARERVLSCFKNLEKRA